jgi:high-affinity iron transporter
MLQSLVVMLREGVEAALIVGIVLTYLAKISRSDLKRVVFWALGSACLASVALAIVFSRYEINTDKFEGWVMLVAAFFVVSMIVFMMKTARFLKKHIEERLGELSGKAKGSALGIFLFVFLMVLREGAETVLILAALSLNSTELASLLGTLIGIALSVTFGVMFVKGSVKVNLQRFFKVTTVILFFVAAQLVISGLHELSESGVIPSSKQEMSIIGPIVRNDVFFFITIVALAGLMVLFEARRRQGVQPAQATTESKAAQRKAEWSARRERLWSSAVYVASFVFILLVTAEFIYAKSTTSLSAALEVPVTNGQVTIPVSMVSDGDLHRFSATLPDGVQVRFFLIKKPDGKIASVMDACSICGPVGFYKAGGQIICKNCSAPVNPQSVGDSGGCNPIPIASSTNGGDVVIMQAALQQQEAVFQGR